MKRSLLLAVFVIWSVLMIGHPPSDMEISFNNEELILTVVVSHGVGNPTNHYVDKVTVRGDDNQLIVHEMTRQDDARTVTLTYRIPDAVKGTVLTIVADCNRFGSLTREFEVE